MDLPFGEAFTIENDIALYGSKVNAYRIGDLFTSNLEYARVIYLNVAGLTADA